MASNLSKYKKRSVQNLRSKLPNDLVFFLDRSLGKKKIAEALRMTGATVLIHDDHFSPDEQDINWLKVAGEKGWIVLTKDSRIRYRVLEKTTLMNAGVAAFILTSADLKGNEMAEIFVNALPAISKTIKKYQKPFIAKITRNGRVSVLEN
jgi:predicted nuclease of predicted toxin-antitoxin system